MLVLARKVGESIQIGDDVYVTILHIGRGRVQIGLEAPRDVAIRREELAPSSPQWARLLPLPHAAALANSLEIAIG